MLDCRITINCSYCHFEVEITKLVWHQHRDPRRARCSRGGVGHSCRCSLSLRRTLWDRQECLSHINQNDKGTCFIAAKDETAPLAWSSLPCGAGLVHSAQSQDVFALKNILW